MNTNAAHFIFLSVSLFRSFCAAYFFLLFCNILSLFHWNSHWCMLATIAFCPFSYFPIHIFRIIPLIIGVLNLLIAHWICVTYLPLCSLHIPINWYGKMLSMLHHFSCTMQLNIHLRLLTRLRADETLIYRILWWACIYLFCLFSHHRKRLHLLTDVSIKFRRMKEKKTNACHWITGFRCFLHVCIAVNERLNADEIFVLFLL